MSKAFVHKPPTTKGEKHKILSSFKKSEARKKGASEK